jgi:hypothetical protein
MKSLLRNERELIFDYFFGFFDDVMQAKEARELIETRSGAAQFHKRLHVCLKPLSHYLIENCPCHLCEITIHRLMSVAQYSKPFAKILLFIICLS